MLMDLLFPIICNNNEEFSLIYHPRMKGIFVGDTNKPEWEDKIVILFDTCAPPKFKEFFNKNLYKYQNYYETIDNKHYEILAFVIPPQNKNDIANLLNNQIEGVSFAYKNHIENVTQLVSDDYPWVIGNKKIPITKEYLELDLNGVNKKAYNNVCLSSF